MNTPLVHVDGLEMAFEPPDVTFVRWHGTATEHDVAALTQLCEKIRAEGTPSTVLLIDMREGDTISPAARKQMATMSSAKYWRATVCFGASFKTRVLIQLANNAIRLISREPAPLEFLDSEAAAWARAAELRIPTPA